MYQKKFKFDVSIIGGVGHIGLPLGLLLKKQNLRVALIDIDEKNINLVNQKKMPFFEKGAQKLLNNGIFVTNDFKYLKQSKTIIICIGTPIDEYFNPKIDLFFKLIFDIKNILLETKH